MTMTLARAAAKRRSNLVRRSIVLTPEDEAILDRLRREMRISSRSRAIRLALRAAARELEYERIRRGYETVPEGTRDVKETADVLRMSVRGLERERW